MYCGQHVICHVWPALLSSHKVVHTLFYGAPHHTSVMEKTLYCSIRAAGIYLCEDSSTGNNQTSTLSVLYENDVFSFPAAATARSYLLLHIWAVLNLSICSILISNSLTSSANVKNSGRPGTESPCSVLRPLASASCLIFASNMIKNAPKQICNTRFLSSSVVLSVLAFVSLDCASTAWILKLAQGIISN